jgi:hypothetical protein
MLKKIISGGQTGADRAALDAAINVGLSHGGWIPKGRLTEHGPLPEKYNLQEMPTASYPKRTEQNVIDSDGTLIMSQGNLTGGSLLTQELAEKHKKPCLQIDFSEEIIYGAAVHVDDWTQEHGIEVLNVAGPRASKDPKIYAKVLKVLEIVYHMQSSAVQSRVARQMGLAKTVSEAVELLLSQLPLKDRTEIASMDEEDLVDLHFSLGAYIRNEFGLWFGNRQLLDDCRTVSMDQYLHPDQASSVIIRELWKRLRKTHRLRAIK